MDVYVTKKDGSKLNITNIVTDITVSGDYSQVARVLEFSIVQNLVVIDLGDIVRLFINGVEFFNGYVFTKERSDETEIKFKAYDGLIYLVKSKDVMNVKNSTPEDVIRKICNLTGVSCGNIINTNVKISKVFMDNSYVDIIQTLYNEVSKINNKKYMLRMSAEKLNVIERGLEVAKIVLKNDENIIDSRFGESIENLVNKVKVIDNNGNILKIVSDDELIKLYGILPNVYRSDDKTVPVAQSLLTGVERASELTILGGDNLDFITGNSVMIEDKNTGLIGKFIIDADTHSWNDNVHVVRLKLSFDKVGV